jgi:hypothetical protein
MGRASEHEVLALSRRLHIAGITGRKDGRSGLWPARRKDCRLWPMVLAKHVLLADSSRLIKKIPGHEGPGKLKGSDSEEYAIAPQEAQ